MIVYECGICGHYHPWEWSGDCRDDDNRFDWHELNMLDLDPTKDPVEVRTMTDRLEADGFYTAEEADEVRRELDDYSF